MHILFRAFAFLDLFSLAFMTMQLVSIVNNFAKLTLLSDKVQSILMFPMYLLVAVGAYGLFFQKRLVSLAIIFNFLLGFIFGC